MPVVRDLCDSVTWLNNGVLQQSGPAQAVVDAYLASVEE